MSHLEISTLHSEFPARTGLKSLRGLTFDDVSILPARTNVRPDGVVPHSIVLTGLVAGVPVFAAPMDTVWSVEMTCSLAEFGAIAPIARDLPVKKLEKAIRAIRAHRIDLTKHKTAVQREGRPVVVVAASPFDEERLKFLVGHAEVDYILLDTVHPFNDATLDAVRRFSAESPYRIAVGNVATAEAAYEFCQYPIAALKVGLGPGSICTTREISGIGVPQLEAIQEVSRVAREFKVPVIADGGIRTCGDIAKALAAGADSVMMGRLFAGTLESPGEVVERDGRKFKFYAGSKYNSVGLTEDTGDSDLDSFLGELRSQDHRVEGVSGYTPLSGPAKALLLQIQRSLGASFAFVGAKNIREFREKARFIQISSAAHREGGAHSIPVVTERNHFFKPHAE